MHGTYNINISSLSLGATRIFMWSQGGQSPQLIVFWFPRPFCSVIEVKYGSMISTSILSLSGKFYANGYMPPSGTVFVCCAFERFEVLTAVLLKTHSFWDVIQCMLEE